MTAAGFTLAGADHAIIPVMLGEAVWRKTLRASCKKKGFTSPGSSIRWYQKARRVFVPRCRGAYPEQIERAVEAFTRIGKQLGVIA
jgi:glycine C-acetyltransferase